MSDKPRAHASGFKRHAAIIAIDDTEDSADNVYTASPVKRIDPPEDLYQAIQDKRLDQFGHILSGSQASMLNYHPIVIVLCQHCWEPGLNKLVSLAGNDLSYDDLTAIDDKSRTPDSYIREFRTSGIVQEQTGWDVFGRATYQRYRLDAQSLGNQKKSFGQRFRQIVALYKQTTPRKPSPSAEQIVATPSSQLVAATPSIEREDHIWNKREVAWIHWFGDVDEARCLGCGNMIKRDHVIQPDGDEDVGNSTTSSLVQNSTLDVSFHRCHVIPRSAGGAAEKWNMVILCNNCNTGNGGNSSKHMLRWAFEDKHRDVKCLQRIVKMLHEKNPELHCGYTYADFVYGHYRGSDVFPPAFWAALQERTPHAVSTDQMQSTITELRQQVQRLQQRQSLMESKYNKLSDLVRSMQAQTASFNH